jgi:hypothetical protein
MCDNMKKVRQSDAPMHTTSSRFVAHSDRDSNARNATTKTKYIATLYGGFPCQNEETAGLLPIECEFPVEKFTALVKLVILQVTYNYSKQRFYH